MLTHFWTHSLPVIQRASPAELAASVIADAVEDLESRGASEIVVVDYCSGGGGPVPTIERLLNAGRRREGAKPIRFVMTDLHPHVEAWRLAARESPHLDYVADSVDAANAPSRVTADGSDRVRDFRLFCLSFHHFDDQMARRILRDTMAKSDGIA